MQRESNGRSRRRKPSAEPIWDVIPYMGRNEYKRCRIRHLDRVDEVLAHVRRHDYVVILGPHYSEKSRLLDDVQAKLTDDPAFHTVYVNLWQARSDNEQAFFASMEKLVRAGLQDAAAETEDVWDPRSFQNFLGDSVMSLSAHLLLLIDHLQALPPDLVHSLLQALRAARMETPPTRAHQLVVVVAGGMNLADLSQGPTSPFNIARQVAVSPLDDDQSSTLAARTLDAYKRPYSPNALAQIQHFAGGDPLLIAKICYYADQVVEGYRRNRITKSVVDQAVANLLRDDRPDVPMHRSIQHIEEDPEILLDVLDLLHQGYLPFDRSRQSISPFGISRLQLTGAVTRDGQGFRIKNELFRQALRDYFSPTRVAHILRMNGRWQEAIDYLVSQPRHGALTPARNDLLEAIVQSIYAADDLESAFTGLVRGVQLGFDLSHVRVYRADATHSELRLVYGSEDDSPPQCIRLEENDRVEVQTFFSGDYALRNQADDMRLVTALVPEKRPIGVVTVEHFCPRLEGSGLPETLPELRRFLRHAAGAVENVMLRTAFQEIGRAVLDVNAVTDGLGQVLQIVSNAVGSDLSSLYLLDVADQALEQTVFVGRYWETHPPARRRIPLSESHPAVECLTRAQTRPTRAVSPKIDKRGMRNITRVFLPLQAAGSWLGVLKLGFDVQRAGNLNSEDVATMGAFADQVAIAVYNVQLLRQTDAALARRVDELQRLQEINRTLVSTLRLDRVLQQIVENVRSLFTGCHVTIWRHDPAQHALHIDESSIQDPAYLAQTIGSHSTAARVVESRCFMLLEDVEGHVTETTLSMARLHGLRSLLVVPMESRGTVLGVISLYMPPDHKLDVTQRELLEAMAAQAAVAIDNATQYQNVAEAERKLRASRNQDLVGISSVLLHRLKDLGDIPLYLHSIRAAGVGSDMVTYAIDHIEQRVQKLRSLVPPFRTVVNLAELEFVTLDLRHVVLSALDGLELCKVRTVERDLPPDPVWIRGNMEFLRDAFRSIIENACEATDPQGEIWIVMSPGRRNEVKVHVSDDGPGIPEELQDRIYQLGFSTRAREKRERGLGLFTCRAILRMHRGDVELVESTPQGSTFEIRLQTVERSQGD